MFSLTRYWTRKGNTARDERRWTAARDAYAKALRCNPKMAHIWVQYGHALKESGAPEDALEAYYRSDVLHPNLSDTHIQIARALDLLGRKQVAQTHYAMAMALSGGPDTPRLRRPVDRPPGMPERLRFLSLGTTGTCNASCVHCPTGKPETVHSPRGTMPMEIFCKIIDGIYDYALPVTDQIAFGLFGDGFLDPLVVRRAEYVHERLPDVKLSINTNGASFNASKHQPLRDLADTIALHCESLDPTTYNYLMQPLRFERVQPKFEPILATFPGQVLVSVPISRRNQAESGAIRDWFMARGAREVAFDPLSSRCAEDRSIFDSLALAPQPIRCLPEIMDDLIVDCDGQVLICCQDFQRIEGIGSFATDTFADVMAGAQRHRARDILAENRHKELATCSRCFADIRSAFEPA